MKKREKRYLSISSETLNLESKGFHCFGCGEDFSEEDRAPEFKIETEDGEKSLCLPCAVLARKKSERKIRSLEYDPLTMAAVHKRNHVEFIKKAIMMDFPDLMEEIFPDIPKARLIGQDQTRDGGLA